MSSKTLSFVGVIIFGLCTGVSVFANEQDAFGAGYSLIDFSYVPAKGTISSAYALKVRYTGDDAGGLEVLGLMLGASSLSKNCLIDMFNCGQCAVKKMLSAWPPYAEISCTFSGSPNETSPSDANIQLITTLGYGPGILLSTATSQNESVPTVEPKSIALKKKGNYDVYTMLTGFYLLHTTADTDLKKKERYIIKGALAFEKALGVKKDLVYATLKDEKLPLKFGEDGTESCQGALFPNSTKPTAVLVSCDLLKEKNPQLSPGASIVLTFDNVDPANVLVSDPIPLNAAIDAGLYMLKKIIEGVIEGVGSGSIIISGGTSSTTGGTSSTTTTCPEGCKQPRTVCPETGGRDGPRLAPSWLRKHTAAPPKN
jgi:hypothetical protein